MSGDQQTTRPWDDEDGEWDDQAADECEHDNAEYDVIEGRMQCPRGYSRFLSDTEIEHEAAFQADLMQAMYEEAERDVSNG